MPSNVIVNVPSSESLELNVRLPDFKPNVLVSKPIVKVVELPAVTVVLPKVLTNVKPVGTERLDNVKSDVPRFSIVKVLFAVELCKLLPKS